MYTNSVILAFLAATCAIAAPLNINLGAYSPALVVGDGEISFGGGAEAEALVNTLAGASVGGAAAPAAGANREAVPVAVPDTATPVAAKPGPSPLPSSISSDIRKMSDPDEPPANSFLEKRDLQGFNAALNYASAALKTSPGVELGTGEGGSGVGITVKPGGAVA